MQSVSTFFKEEEDFLYQRGQKERNQEVAKSLILESDFSNKKIAHIAKINMTYVEKLRAELNAK